MKKIINDYIVQDTESGREDKGINKFMKEEKGRTKEF